MNKFKALAGLVFEASGGLLALGVTAWICFIFYLASNFVVQFLCSFRT